MCEQPIIPDTVVTRHSRSKKIGSAFAQGCGGKTVSVEEFLLSRDRGNIATYGILRGSGECLKKSAGFWYIDHGYFGRSQCLTKCEGYFRIARNALWHSGSGNCSWDRFNHFGIELKDWRKHGDHVVVVPPSRLMGAFLGLESWLNDTIIKIRQCTDRPVVISEKKRHPIAEVLKNAWVVITDHSNAAIDAMVEGVPAIMTDPIRKLGDITGVENPPLDRDLFRNLAYHQWTLEEIASGTAWEMLNIQHVSPTSNRTW